jgi:1-acyl-sn-glycerol-3-phosphate acyltransferase
MTTHAPQAKWIEGLIAAFFSIIIFLPLLIINALQMISILWKPISRRAFRRYNTFWGRTYWTYVSLMSQHVGRLRVEYSGDVLPSNENALVLANHQSATDTVIQLMVGHRFGRVGDMKFFVKDALKWVPGPGWGMVFLECIFMKRNWNEDRARVVRQLRKIRDQNVPIWLNLYPEGTRMKPSRRAETQEYARKAGLPIPQNVLIPRVRGFTASLEGLEGHLQAIYDLTIVYPDHPMTLWELLSCRGSRIKVELKRYGIEELPVSEEGRSQWLLDLFQRKDKRIPELVYALKQAPEPLSTLPRMNKENR